MSVGFLGFELFGGGVGSDQSQVPHPSSPPDFASGAKAHLSSYVSGPAEAACTLLNIYGPLCDRPVPPLPLSPPSLSSSRSSDSPASLNVIRRTLLARCHCRSHVDTHMPFPWLIHRSH